MLNNIQNQIVNLINENLKNKAIENLRTDYYSALDVAFSKEWTREEFANMYIFLTFFTTLMVEKNAEYLILLDKINKIFDESKYDGYIAGSYQGCRQGLLTLGLFNDVKLLALPNSYLQVILSPLENVDITSPANKVLIANAIFKYSALTLYYGGDPVNLITQSITASTGQAIEINYYKVITRFFKMTITYKLDYEEQQENLNYKEEIESSVNATYSKIYGYIGKDYKVKDFYSITRDVLGITDIRITIDETDSEGTIIGTPFVDVDIPLLLTELFVISDIVSVQDN